MLSEKVIIHSDRGVHYTRPNFHNMLKNITLNNQRLEEVIIGIMHLRNHILVL